MCDVCPESTSASVIVEPIDRQWFPICGSCITPYPGRAWGHLATARPCRAREEARVSAETRHVQRHPGTVSTRRPVPVRAAGAPGFPRGGTAGRGPCGQATRPAHAGGAAGSCRRPRGSPRLRSARRCRRRGELAQHRGALWGLQERPDFVDDDNASTARGSVGQLLQDDLGDRPRDIGLRGACASAP